MSFLSTQETAFGLDISDQALRLTQFAKFGRKAKLQLYNEIELPDGCLINGEIQRRDVFALAVKKLLRTKMGRGQLSRQAIIALPESETFLNSLTINAETEQEIPAKVAEILPENLPLDLTDIYWDWQVVERTGSNWQIITGASPKRIVDEYLEVFSACGLIPVVLEIEAAAISRLLIEQGHDHESQLVIDIGRNRTGLFLYDGRTARFTVSLPISGNQLNDLIVQTLDLSSIQAEEAKIVCGLDEQKCQGALLELLSPAIEDLARRIIETVNFYYENFSKPQEIKKIVLCGGGANLIGIAPALAKATDLTTVLSQPFAQIANPNKHFFTGDKSQSFITALGLGLRGLEPETFYDHA